MSTLTPKTKRASRARRHARVRAKVSGTPERPRLSVFRSNTALYAQLIDDASGTTIAGASSRALRGKSLMEQAASVGEAIAKRAAEKGVAAVVFDRGGFAYAGAVRALADSARKSGLKF